MADETQVADVEDDGVLQLRPAGGPYAVQVLDGHVIRPGDHLLVRVDPRDLSQEEADEIVQQLRARLPGLADVTLIGADGLYVYRPEVGTDG